MNSAHSKSVKSSALIIITLLCMSSVTALSWSEILFNPQGTDDTKEFAEFNGTEDLAGCQVRDSASADTLVLLHNGTIPVILIVEDASALVNSTNATVYGAGLAIGNGLGNAYDSLSIICNGTEFLTTAYNISQINGLVEGYSIIYDNGSWILGALDGTPGVVHVSSQGNTTPPVPSPIPPKPKPGPATTGGGGGGGLPMPGCNGTLVLTVSTTRGYVGDTVLFTVLSEMYASFTATINGSTVASGDTATTNEHSVLLTKPGSLRIAASAKTCEGTIRATRYVAVLPQENNGDTAPEFLALSPNTSLAEELPPVETADELPLQKSTLSPPVVVLTTPMHDATSENILAAPEHITGAVVLDSDKEVVGWVSAFGIVTLVVSAGLFWKLSRREMESKEEPSGGKVYKE